MSQQILFKRGLKVYNSLAEVDLAFNSLTWTAGEPVMACYKDDVYTRIVFAIGIADGIGATNYKKISDQETIEKLLTSVTETVSTLSDSLSAHEDQLASGENSGHVVNSETSEILFTDGVAGIKDKSVTLDKISTSSLSGVIGYLASDLSSTNNNAPAKVISWSQFVTELANAGATTFNSVKINNETVSADSFGDTLELSFSDKFSVTKNPNSEAISIDIIGSVGGGEISGSLPLTTTENCPVVITGTTSAIVTSFAQNAAFPSNPIIQTDAISLGDSNDTENSTVVPTIGYVVKKINSVLASNDAMHYEGSLDPNTANFKLPAGNAGDTYKFSNRGNVLGIGEVHIGDMLICRVDDTPEDTVANWDLICVGAAGATIVTPENVTEGNIVVFGSNSAILEDSNVKVSDFLTKDSIKVEAGTGLVGTGEMDNYVISHEPIVTESNKDEENTVIQDIEVAGGHITRITYGKRESGLSLVHDGETNWQGNYLKGGLMINGISLKDNVLTAYASDLPGVVRADSGTSLGYLGTILSGKTTLKENEYAISTAVNGDKVELSVLIDKIDGGTF